jgi:hypothetical protein
MELECIMIRNSPAYFYYSLEEETRTSSAIMTSKNILRKKKKIPKYPSDASKRIRKLS